MVDFDLSREIDYLDLDNQHPKQSEEYSEPLKQNLLEVTDDHLNFVPPQVDYNCTESTEPNNSRTLSLI